MYLPFRLRRSRGTAEGRGILAEVERDTVEPGADPHDLAGRAQLVELGRAIPRNAPRQPLVLPKRNGKGVALKRDKRLAQGRATVDALPAGEEAAESSLLRRLHFAAQGS